MKSADYRKLAFDMIRRHGFREALRLAERHRDCSAEGTVSFATNNAIAKIIRADVETGTSFRRVS